MNNKKCIHCDSFNVIKKGFNKDKIQRWKCRNCKKIFQANRKALPKMEELFYSFSFHKQTLKELSTAYHIRSGEVQRSIDEYILPKVIHAPREIYLQVDGTYFGSKENKFCAIVFRDYLKKDNVWWTFDKTETELSYRKGKVYLESLGYIIKGIVSDGLPLIRRVFKGIQFQMCLVHMERIIIRGTTRKPKLEASQVLYAIARSLHITNSKVFNDRMNRYTLRYFHFLNEKTTSEVTGEWWYTHERLREAFISLQNLSEYLFTYEKDSNLSKNTNSIEGTFTHVKNKLAAHNGLSVKRKEKLRQVFLHYGSGSEDYLK